MGTRCDFYVMDKKNKLNWVGSYGWDGYPDGNPKGMKLHKVTTEEDYKKKVITFLEDSEGYITGRDGWPWPWDNSGTSDHYYFFYDGAVWCGDLYIGEGEYTIKLKDFLDNIDEFGDHDDCDEEVEKKAQEMSFKDKYKLPDMSKVKDVDLGRSSGVMILRS